MTMKKDTQIVSILTMIIIFLLGAILGILVYKGIHKEEKEEVNNEEELVKASDIDVYIKEYDTLNKSKIYLTNLNEVYLDDDSTLEDYLKDNKISDSKTLFDKLEGYLELKTKLKDGGTIIYNVKDGLFKKDISIIKCNTEDGNNDIYFNASYINTTDIFKTGACGKKLFSMKEFARVYTIDNIKVLKDYVDDKTKEKSYDVELDIKDSNNTLVKITSLVNEDTKKLLKENTKYTFYFENKYQESIKDDITDILNTCTSNSGCSIKGIVPLNS